MENSSLVNLAFITQRLHYKGTQYTYDKSGISESAPSELGYQSFIPPKLLCQYLFILVAYLLLSKLISYFLPDGFQIDKQITYCQPMFVYSACYNRQHLSSYAAFYFSNFASLIKSLAFTILSPKLLAIYFNSFFVVCCSISVQFWS